MFHHSFAPVPELQATVYFKQSKRVSPQNNPTETYET